MFFVNQLIIESIIGVNSKYNTFYYLLSLLIIIKVAYINIRKIIRGLPVGIFEDNALKYFENGYNILPVEPNSKAVKVPSWQQYSDNKQVSWQVDSWLSSYANHNVGIPLGHASGIIGLDFDDDMDGLHEAVQKLLQGSLVKKKGRKGFTAFYRYNGEVTKRWRKDGKTVVELLSSGTQTVMPPSIHPDTKEPYIWLTEDTLFDLQADDLTYLPNDFVEKVDKLFGYKEKIIDYNNKYDSGDLPDISDIEDALSYVPSDDYATWITIGMALQHNYGDAAFTAWDNWSRKAPNYSDSSMSYKWSSFGNYGGNVVSIGTIFHYAVGYGYIVVREPEFNIPADFKLMAGNVNLITGEVEKEDVNETNFVDMPDSLEFPKHLLEHAPGLPGEIAAWINSTALKRQPVLALAAGICAAGTIFAHRVRNDSNLRTNFMVLGLAESGAGKNHARECIKSLFYACNMEQYTFGKFASDSGLINALSDNNGVGLALVDEIGRELQSLNSKGAGGHETRLLTAMMEIYSEAGSYYDGKRYASAENFKKLVQPLLCIYGTTVPKRFFDSMTSDEAIDGFLARWLVFQSNDIDPPMQQRGNVENVPTTLMENIIYIRNMPIYKPQDEGNSYSVEAPIPAPRVINYSDAAKDILYEFSEACNANRMAEIKRGGLLAPIWARSREHAIKLALVAHPYRNDVIDSITMQWACEMAMYLSQVAVKTIQDNVSDSDHEKLLNKVKGVIVRWCSRNSGEFMPHRTLCSYVKFIRGRERNEILQQLHESGIINIQVNESKNGQKSNSYKVL